MTEYRERSDTVFRFISERYMITGVATDLVSKQEFDEEYLKWCSDGDNDYKPVKKNNMKERMDAIGCPVTKGNIGSRRGIYCYRGIVKQGISSGEFTPLSENEQFELPFD